MSDLIPAVIGYGIINHYFTSADGRQSNKMAERQFEYQKQSDQQRKIESERANLERQKEASADRYQRELDRENAERQARLDRNHQIAMQEAEHEIRREEIEAQRDAIYNQRYIAELNAKNTYLIAEKDREAYIYNAELDREAMLRMKAEELSQQEQLVLRKLRVQENIAQQSSELQKYLFDKGIKNSQELERFKALATRETQILIARENAQSALNDKLVQQALNDFPLNISPIVLLQKNRDSLMGLLRFSTHLTDKAWLPSVSDVYEDINQYCANPEAITVFVAPIHVSQAIEHRESISEKIWDAIYQKLESFMLKHYSRNGNHPSIVYPTAWKNGMSSGQHASETLHFFLKDMPCIVLEPRFDGQFLKVIVSSWGIGYLNSEHTREEMVFDTNLDFMMIEAAYKRSVKSLSLLSRLSDLSPELTQRKKECEHNVKYYEMLDISDKTKNNDFEEIVALGSYRLFNIDTNLDLSYVGETIAALICLNIAIITDVHHLVATDASPVFPIIFKQEFPILFDNIDIRQLTFKCYEKVYLFLRHQEGMTAGTENRREIERVREIQITNLQKQLELISERVVNSILLDKLKKYATERFNISSNDLQHLLEMCIDQMGVDDVPFFKELLPNIDDRKLFKKVDKKISELQRNN